MRLGHANSLQPPTLGQELPGCHLPMHQRYALCSTEGRYCGTEGRRGGTCTECGHGGSECGNACRV
eukprot:434506-Rhodomonas_salina.1